MPHSSSHWNEILAAYADGEFEGRDHLALLKQRVEDWLNRHPETQAELAQYRRLKQLWRETTPCEPGPERWRVVLEALQNQPTEGHTASWQSGLRWRRVVAMAAPLAACVALAVTWLLQPVPAVKPVAPPAAVVEESYEVLSVATMDEVEILRVEGADIGTLVVGALPVQGLLELAGPGEVTVTSMEPDARDQMVPVVRSAGRPMIWARLESE